MCIRGSVQLTMRSTALSPLLMLLGDAVCNAIEDRAVFGRTPILRSRSV